MQILQKWKTGNRKLNISRYWNLKHNSIGFFCYWNWGFPNVKHKSHLLFNSGPLPEETHYLYLQIGGNGASSGNVNGLKGSPKQTVIDDVYWIFRGRLNIVTCTGSPLNTWRPKRNDRTLAEDISGAFDLSEKCYLSNFIPHFTRHEITYPCCDLS